MTCPKCKNQELSEKIKIGSVTLDKCNSCGGTWFEGDELRQAKDEKATYAKWFDFDLWKDPKSFSAEEGEHVCPTDNLPLYKLHYGKSDIEIDACKECNGIWLDKGEFERIIEYVKKQADYDVLSDYMGNLIQEGKEVFSGPESLRSEAADVLLLIKLFQYKFMTQHPNLTQILLHLPLT